MNYYKLIKDSRFIGVVTQQDFRVFQRKHNILLACAADKAQYIQCANVFFRADWMSPVITDKIPYETVEMLEIDKKEYDILLKAMDSGEEIIIEPEQPEPIEQPIDENENITVEYVKSRKIAEMSAACNSVITNGFDVELSDNNSYHFSLTTQDQLNLITLSAMVSSGETAIPYHADGELCKFYSAEDINTIVSTATAFKTYQVSYYNALRAYIESMTDIGSIGAITYGIAIPYEYQSDVLKVLIKQIAIND